MPTLSIERRELPAQPVLIIRRRIPRAELQATMAECFGKCLRPLPEGGHSARRPAIHAIPLDGSGALDDRSAASRWRRRRQVTARSKRRRFRPARSRWPYTAVCTTAARDLRRAGAMDRVEGPSRRPGLHGSHTSRARPSIRIQPTGVPKCTGRWRSEKHRRSPRRVRDAVGRALCDAGRRDRNPAAHASGSSCDGVHRQLQHGHAGVLGDLGDGEHGRGGLCHRASRRRAATWPTRQSWARFRRSSRCGRCSRCAATSRCGSGSPESR